MYGVVKRLKCRPCEIVGFGRSWPRIPALSLYCEKHIFVRIQAGQCSKRNLEEKDPQNGKMDSPGMQRGGIKGRGAKRQLRQRMKRTSREIIRKLIQFVQPRRVSSAVESLLQTEKNQCVLQ
jgi:hypothetical protein